MRRSGVQIPSAPPSTAKNPDRALRLKRFRTSLAGGFFDRGWKRVRSVLLAVRQNLRGIPLQAVVIQNIAVCRRVVISAHPISHEILALRAVSKPILASHLVHIHV